MDEEIRIREAGPEDAQTLLEIYRYYVDHTAVTYEYETPSLEAFQGRIRHVQEMFPYLVAEKDGEILGYAYAGAFHPRAAYAWNAEMTIYLKNGVQGKGLGTRMYTFLEEMLKAQGIVRTIGIITPPRTESEKSMYPSVAFHEKMGYSLMGRMEHCGYKFGQWYPTVWMEKIIGVPKEDMEPLRNFQSIKWIFGF